MNIELYSDALKETSREPHEQCSLAHASCLLRHEWLSYYYGSRSFCVALDQNYPKYLQQWANELDPSLRPHVRRFELLCGRVRLSTIVGALRSLGVFPNAELECQWAVLGLTSDQRRAREKFLKMLYIYTRDQTAAGRRWDQHRETEIMDMWVNADHIQYVCQVRPAGTGLSLLELGSATDFRAATAPFQSNSGQDL